MNMKNMRRSLCHMHTVGTGLCGRSLFVGISALLFSLPMTAETVIGGG